MPEKDRGFFGFACHATVTNLYKWSGDYPGFAQIEVEKSYPETISLFWDGCSADQKPLPRRNIELVRSYGDQLASAVEKTLQGKMQPIDGALTTAYEEISLPFGAPVSLQDT